MDVELTCCGAPAVFVNIPTAIAGGRLSEAVLDQALTRALRIRFELGVGVPGKGVAVPGRVGLEYLGQGTRAWSS